MIRKMKKLFKIPREGKLSEQTLFAQIALSLTVILLCVAAMTSSAYALFGISATSGENKVITSVPDTGKEVFTSAFPYADRMLYRVGNMNEFDLGKVFKLLDGKSVDSASVTLTVERVAGMEETVADYTPNASNWASGTLKFNGTGVVRLTIKDRFSSPFELYLEVVEGINATTYSELTSNNGNKVLLNDITMSANGKCGFSNATIYGNGFTFDVRDGKHGDTSNGSNSSNYVILLRNSNLDNIQIVGKVYNTYGGQVKDDYNYPCIYATGNCSIVNSYISNCASPIRAVSADVYFENTTLKGGSFCNLDIRHDSHITVNGLTTINQVANNDPDDGGVARIGLGIVFYYESMSKNETLTILNDSLIQYNWIANNQRNYASTISFSGFGSYNTLDEVFQKTDEQHQYTDDSGIKWVNTGILSLDSDIGNAAITTQSGYQWKTGISMMGHAANLCAKAASAQQIAEAYIPTAQYAHLPIVTKETAGDTYTDGKLLISFASGETYIWNADKVSAVANGKSLDVSIAVNGGTGVAIDPNTNQISFTEAGSFEVVYTYSVNDNYRLANNGTIESYAKSYTTTIQVVAETGSVKPLISFNDFNTQEYEIGPKTYLLVTDAKTTVTNIGSITEQVNGQEITVNYPIIEYKGSMSKTVYWPVLGDVVTIKGDGVSYDHTTTSMPTGLTCYWGRYYGKVDSEINDKSFGGTIGSNVYKEVFNCARGGSATVQIDVYEDQVAYLQKVNNSNRKDWTFLVKYCYQEGGYTFYYYIGYKEGSSSSGGGCFAEGTLITLADGTRIPVEDLTGQEELLVWNLETGKYEAAPIVFIDSDPLKEYTILHVCFSDGTDVNVVYEHGFFDYDLGKYVYITEETMNDYIGHRFVKEGSLQEGTWELVTLTDVWAQTEAVKVYSPVTARHLCYYTDGILSMPGGIEGLFNIFDTNTETMTVDADAMARDIETYGLLTLEDFGGLITEEMFDAFNGRYLGVAMGKGMITREEIEYLANRYAPLCD